MQAFMTTFYSCWAKDKDFPRYIHKAVIVGFLRVAKAGIFSELNNLSVYSALDDKQYSTYFGLTYEEVRKFSKKKF